MTDQAVYTPFSSNIEGVRPMTIIECWQTKKFNALLFGQLLGQFDSPQEAQLALDTAMAVYQSGQPVIGANGLIR